MNKKRLLLLLPLFGFCLPATGEIYRWTDENGEVIYSDQPRQGAETVKLPGITSYRGPSTPKSSRPVTSNDKGKASYNRYKTFNIASPVNDSTIRENSGRVDVSLVLDPPMFEGDSVVYELSGQRFKVVGSSHSLSNVDRGTHTLKAHIVDSKGQQVSPVVSTTFHLKRISTLNKSKAKPKAP